MSKPSSGHFNGTMGNISLQASTVKNTLKYDKIAKGLDFREHPTKYKQLSSKKMAKLNEKERNRTITKDEYKRKEWQKRLNKRRKAGIDAFWDHEKFCIKHNLPTTRNWSATQRNDILNNKRPKFKNTTMQSHHTYNVAKYPHLANIGFLIYPVTFQEHYNRWHGGNYRNSYPGRPINTKIKEDF